MTPRACAQAIRKAHETGWRPMRFIASGCANKDTVMVPAGLEAGKGICRSVRSSRYVPDAEGRSGDVAYIDFMKARLPNADLGNFAARYGYMVAAGAGRGAEAVQEQSERENIMAQAANLKNVPLSLLLPGITLNTSPTGFPPDQGRLYGRVPRQPVGRGQRIAARLVTLTTCCRTLRRSVRA